MRGLAFLICAMLPGAALAEPVVLRVEAQRAAAAEAMTARWAGRYPEVMRFPLPGGWTGIGLGPMEREEAEAELARLSAAGEIPGDSFIVPVPEGAQPVTAAVAGTAGAQPDGAGPAEGTSTFAPQGAGTGNATASPAPDTAAAEPVIAPPPGDYLRLQRFDTREAADAALETWRKDFPEAGLFQQPDGGLAIALGPMSAAVAEAWLGAFRRAERIALEDSAVIGTLISTHAGGVASARRPA